MIHGTHKQMKKKFMSTMFINHNITHYQRVDNIIKVATQIKINEISTEPRKRKRAVSRVLNEILSGLREPLIVSLMETNRRPNHTGMHYLFEKTNLENSVQAIGRNEEIYAELSIEALNRLMKETPS